MKTRLMSLSISLYAFISYIFCVVFTRLVLLTFFLNPRKDSTKKLSHGNINPIFNEIIITKLEKVIKFMQNKC